MEGGRSWRDSGEKEDVKEQGEREDVEEIYDVEREGGVEGGCGGGGRGGGGGPIGRAWRDAGASPAQDLPITPTFIFSSNLNFHHHIIIMSGGQVRNGPRPSASTELSSGRATWLRLLIGPHDVHSCWGRGWVGTKAG